MPRLMMPEDLNQVRDRARGSLTTRLDAPITGRGDHGRLRHRSRRTRDAARTAGWPGAARESRLTSPLQTAPEIATQAPACGNPTSGRPSVTYANVRSDLVPNSSRRAWESSRRRGSYPLSLRRRKNGPARIGGRSPEARHRGEIEAFNLYSNAAKGPTTRLSGGRWRKWRSKNGAIASSSKTSRRAMYVGLSAARGPSV